MNLQPGLLNLRTVYDSAAGSALGWDQNDAGSHL